MKEDEAKSTDYFTLRKEESEEFKFASTKHKGSIDKENVGLLSILSSLSIKQMS